MQALKMIVSGKNRNLKLCIAQEELEPLGIYLFKFFKDFSWRYVIIDDRIPCFRVDD
jgi:hypothetical protein